VQQGSARERPVLSGEGNTTGSKKDGECIPKGVEMGWKVSRCIKAMVKS